jgi:hypothetical protein
VTTIRERSFAGLVMAQLALTGVVCGGLVLLLPTAALSQGLPATISAISVTDCDASAAPAGDHQLTDDGCALSAPDSDDDDDDDDAPTGSDAAIAVDHDRAITRSDLMEVVHIEVDPWISCTVDGHSLRGPPADDQTSSDADDSGGDDDEPSVESSGPPAAATSRETCSLTPLEFLTPSSTRSSVLSLRAPPR